MKQKETISRSLEDYLECILAIQEKTKHVRVTDIAREIGNSKPSVHKAIQNLKAQGLVEHEKYGAITLTIKGECLAKNVLMRHQVLKQFLINIGVSEEKAEEEACAIEHSISVDTVEKLSNYMKI